jgi:archaellin
VEQFGKAIAAIILAAVLAFVAIKVSSFVAASATETNTSPSLQEGHQEGTAQN